MKWIRHRRLLTISQCATELSCTRIKMASETICTAPQYANLRNAGLPVKQSLLRGKQMSEKKTQTPSKVQVNMEKSLRVSKKILDLLQKRTKSSAEAYFAVRLVGLFLEEKLGFKMTSEQEEELRKLWRKDLEKPEKNRSSET